MAQTLDLRDERIFAAWRDGIAAEHEKHRADFIAAARDNRLTRGNLLAYLKALLCARDAGLCVGIMQRLYPDASRIWPLDIAPYENLETWCVRHGDKYEVLHPPGPVDLAPTSPYSTPQSYMTEAIVMAALRKAAWIPGWDYVIGRDGCVIADSGYLPIEYQNVRQPHVSYRAEKVVAYYAPAVTVYVPGNTVFLSWPIEGHIGHWMLDFLPRLQLRAHAGPRPRVAVPSKLEGKHRETLALFCVKDEDLIFCDDDKRYVFETLYVLKSGPSIPPNPVHVHYVRAHISAHKSGPAKGKRLFLSRAHVGTRLARNADALQALLDEQGFQTVELENTTIAEQRAALADAEVLMGAFGSNLLALYFAPPRCTVIVLMDPQMEDPSIAHTCAMLGLRHQALICPDAGESANPRHRKDRDFIVDCDALRRRLLEI